MANASVIKQWLKSGHVSSAPFDALEKEYANTETELSYGKKSDVDIPPNIKQQLRLLAKYVLSDDGQ